MYGVFKISREATPDLTGGFGDIFNMMTKPEISEVALHKVELYIGEFFETEEAAIEAGKEKQAKDAHAMVKSYIKDSIRLPNLNRSFDELEDDAVIAAVNIIILEVPHVFGLGIKKSDVDYDKILKEIEDAKDGK